MEIDGSHNYRLKQITDVYLWLCCKFPDKYSDKNHDQLIIFQKNYVLFNILPYLDFDKENLTLKKNKIIKLQKKINFDLSLYKNNFNGFLEQIFNFLPNKIIFKIKDEIKNDFKNFVGKKYIPYDEYLMIKDFFNYKNIKIEDNELINLYNKHGIFYSDLDRCELFLNKINNIDNFLIDLVKNIRNLLVSKKEITQYKNELEKYKIDVSFENIKNIKTFKEKLVTDKLNSELQNNNFKYIYEYIDTIFDIKFKTESEKNHFKNIAIELFNRIKYSEEFYSVTPIEIVKFAYFCYYSNIISVDLDEFETDKLKEILNICYLPLYNKFDRKNDIYQLCYSCKKDLELINLESDYKFFSKIENIINKNRNKTDVPDYIFEIMDGIKLNYDIVLKFLDKIYDYKNSFLKKIEDYNVLINSVNEEIKEKEEFILKYQKLENNNDLQYMNLIFKLLIKELQEKKSKLISEKIEIKIPQIPAFVGIKKELDIRIIKREKMKKIIEYKLDDIDYLIIELQKRSKCNLISKNELEMYENFVKNEYNLIEKYNTNYSLNMEIKKKCILKSTNYSSIETYLLEDDFTNTFLSLLPKDKESRKSRKSSNRRIYNKIYVNFFELINGKREMYINKQGNFVFNDIHHIDEKTECLFINRLISVPKPVHDYIHNSFDDDYVKIMFNKFRIPDIELENFNTLRKELKNKYKNIRYKLYFKDKNEEIDKIKKSIKDLKNTYSRYNAIKLFVNEKLIFDVKENLKLLCNELKKDIDSDTRFKNNINIEKDEIINNEYKFINKINQIYNNIDNEIKIGIKDKSVNTEFFNNYELRDTLTLISDCFVEFEERTNSRKCNDFTL